MLWSLPGGLLWVFLWHWVTPPGLASQQLLDNFSRFGLPGAVAGSPAAALLVVCPWFLGAATRVPDAVPGALRDPAENKEEHFCGEHMPARAGHALRSQRRLWQRTRTAASAAPASGAVRVDSHVLPSVCSEGLLRLGLCAPAPAPRQPRLPRPVPVGPLVPQRHRVEEPGGLSVCLSPADRRSSSPLAMPAACLCVQQGAPRV